MKMRSCAIRGANCLNCRLGEFMNTQAFHLHNSRSASSNVMHIS